MDTTVVDAVGVIHIFRHGPKVDPVTNWSIIRVRVLDIALTPGPGKDRQVRVQFHYPVRRCGASQLIELLGGVGIVPQHAEVSHRRITTVDDVRGCTQEVLPNAGTDVPHRSLEVELAGPTVGSAHAADGGEEGFEVVHAHQYGQG